MKLVNTDTPSPQINLIPILDTIFFLIFIFMIALIQQSDRGAIKLDLPETKTEILKLNSKAITVAVDTRGHIFLENKRVTPAELQKELKFINIEDQKAKLILKGDKEVNLGIFVEVLDLVKKTGFRNVMIETSSSTNN